MQEQHQQINCKIQAKDQEIAAFQRRKVGYLEN